MGLVAVLAIIHSVNISDCSSYAVQKGLKVLSPKKFIN